MKKQNSNRLVTSKNAHLQVANRQKIYLKNVAAKQQTDKEQCLHILR